MEGGARDEGWATLRNDWPTAALACCTLITPRWISRNVFVISCASSLMPKRLSSV